MVDWDLIDKEDGTFLSWNGEGPALMLNLGPKEAVFDKLADYLGLPGDSIDVEKTEGEPEW